MGLVVLPSRPSSGLDVYAVQLANEASTVTNTGRDYARALLMLRTMCNQVSVALYPMHGR